jgi:hypothetical protein
MVSNIIWRARGIIGRGKGFVRKRGKEQWDG